MADPVGIPIGRAFQCAANRPVGIDHETGRKAARAKGPCGCPARIKHDIKMADSVFIKEFLHDFCPTTILTKRQNTERLAIHFRRQSIKIGHFLDAGRAPCRPKIDQNNLSFQVLKVTFAAIGLDENRLFRQALALRHRLHFRHFLRQLRLCSGMPSINGPSIT